MTTPILDILQSLRRIRQALRNASDLLDLPDINDPAQVYAWSRTLVTVAAQAAMMTPTPVDDWMTAWLLNHPFATYESFLPIYKAVAQIIQLFPSDLTDAAIAETIAATAPEAVAALADNPRNLAGIEMLLLFVSLARTLLSLLR